MSDSNYLGVQEMREVVSLMETLEAADFVLIGVDVKVVDCNGDALGNIVCEGNNYVFRPGVTSE